MLTQKRNAHQNALSVTPVEYFNKHTSFEVATVFGCTGFLGRYIVAELAQAGYQVITPWRNDEFAIMPLRVMGDVGQVVEMRYSPDRYDTILNICARSNIVINCIGRDYDKIFDTKMVDSNVKIPPLIARACRETKVDRMIHISCLNADEKHPSLYLRQKAIGEKLVRNEFPECTILRPGNIYGTEDRFMNWIAKCIRLFPGVPLPRGGAAKIQPIYCVDIADAIIAFLYKEERLDGKVFEMVGPETFTWLSFAKTIAQQINEETSLLRNPKLAGKILGFINEFTWQPGYTRDLYVRQCYDNVANVDSSEVLQIEDMGIKATSFHDNCGELLARWCKNNDYFMNINYKK
jgi:NADH dehydrogenase (ubiquinone) 1 alpha subcomplex subunit 9